MEKTSMRTLNQGPTKGQAGEPGRAEALGVGWGTGPWLPGGARPHSISAGSIRTECMACTRMSTTSTPSTGCRACLCCWAKLVFSQVRGFV